MQDFKNKRILVGVCGGIAAYKIAYLVRELIQLGAEVQVVMTASAKAFIAPMTFQALTGRVVRCELLDEAAEQGMGHIELARWADYCVIAPATANMITKLSHGIADDLLSTLALALKSPLLICPAMNQAMWHHPATVANVKLLRERGNVIVGPAEGIQACGDEGYGRMSDIHEIIHALRLYTTHGLLKGETVLITAGPTMEAIDPVRYLSNHSSGKMGYALARAAQFAGARVHLVTGKTALASPEGVHMHPITSAHEMHDVVMSIFKPGMIFIGAAAVADYTPSEPVDIKMKKQGKRALTLTLKQNPDILAAVAATQKARFVMGFAAETHDVIRHARMKLEAKGLDCIVANQVGAGRGFDVDAHEVTVLTAEAEHTLLKNHKVRLAGELVAILATSLQNNGQVCLTQQKTHASRNTTEST